MTFKASAWSGFLIFLALSMANAQQSEQRGVLQLHDRCSVTIDRGIIRCVVPLDEANDDTQQNGHPTGKNWDFWVQATSKALYLSPQNRTAFAIPRASEAGREGCRAAVYKRDRVRIDNLPTPLHICVRTSDLRFGELTVQSINKSSTDPLSLSYVFWP